MEQAHRQLPFAVRFEWGLAGAEVLAGDVDVVVIVDVLSFTTTLSVAVDAGVTVLPYRWNDASATDFALRHDAVLAAVRSAAGSGRITLSPGTLRAGTALPARLVLPSPNGSTIAHAVVDRSTVCVGACLRNAAAVAAWIARKYGEPVGTVAVIAAGERWPGGALRPAVEDLWGCGAVIASLVDAGWVGLSPEAEMARFAYETVKPELPEALFSVAGGRELVEAGYREDVAIAAESDRSRSVPVLVEQRFVPAG